MLCQICEEQEATVHYTEILNNKAVELHLCEDCARKKEIIDQSGNFSMADLVKGLAGFVETEDHNYRTSDFPLRPLSLQNL